VRTVAIVQARMGSLRLPGKVMKLIEDETAIQRLLSRLNKANTLDEIVLATTDLPEDDELAQHAITLGVPVFRGANLDVLRRFLEAAFEYNASTIVRVTGDCPVIDPSIVDQVVRLSRLSKADYCSNVEPPTFPNGLDVEVFSRDALIWADKETLQIEDREHVTTALRSSERVIRRNLLYPSDHSSERWTLDTSEDLEVIRNIFSQFSGSNDFSWLEILELLKDKPELFAANSHLARNHGSRMTEREKIKLAKLNGANRRDRQV